MWATAKNLRIASGPGRAAHLRDRLGLGDLLKACEPAVPACGPARERTRIGLARVAREAPAAPSWTNLVSPSRLRVGTST